MLNAVRAASHREQVIQDRITAGLYPYAPINAPVPLADAPLLRSGSLADGDVVGASLTAYLAEGALLDTYSTESVEAIAWMLALLMQETRPSGLLGSFEHLTKRDALIFPSFNLALAPPDRWQAQELTGTTLTVTGASVQHTLPGVVTKGLPGDPLGLVTAVGSAVITFTLPKTTALSMLFVPLFPVCAGQLEVDGQLVLPMKTARGLFFWFGTSQVRELRLTLQVEAPICLGLPMAADGDWSRAGAIEAEAGNFFSPIQVKGNGAGALIGLTVGNILEWTAVSLNKTVKLPLPENRLIDTPVAEQLTLPVGTIPSRVWRGYRSWILQQQTQVLGVWTTSTTSYLPLEGADLTVPVGGRAFLRTYLTTVAASTIMASLPGIVTVNGAVQPADKVLLAAGESELVIQLGAGHHRFFLPVPPEVGMRAQYAPASWQLDGETLLVPGAPMIPHEIVLVPATRTATRVRVILPVTQGRPAAIADLEVH